MHEILHVLSQNGWDCIPQTVPFSSRVFQKGIHENLQISAMHVTTKVYVLIVKSTTAYCQIRKEDNQTVNCRNKEEVCTVLQKTVDTFQQFGSQPA